MARDRYAEDLREATTEGWKAGYEQALADIRRFSAESAQPEVVERWRRRYERAIFALFALKLDVEDYGEPRRHAQTLRVVEQVLEGVALDGCEYVRPGETPEETARRWMTEVGS